MFTGLVNACARALRSMMKPERKLRRGQNDAACDSWTSREKRTVHFSDSPIL